MDERFIKWMLSAFLHEELNEEIYMKFSEEYVEDNFVHCRNSYMIENRLHETELQSLRNSWSNMDFISQKLTMVLYKW